jgi:DNA polymerase III alpha subunit (gram-positive type)
MRPADKSPYERAWQSTLQELGTPLRDIEFVVLDLETSGAAPHLGAGITEIAAVRIQGGEVKDTFTTLVNPGHPIPRQITSLTGIDDAMVSEAPYIESALPPLIEFMGGPDTVFVAQNAPFDLSFLKAAARAHGLKWPKQRILDTAILARKILTSEEAPNCKLSTLAHIFGAEIKPTHRALDDVHATIDVLHGLFERLAGFDVYTIEEALSFSLEKKSPGSTWPTSSVKN